MRTWAWTALAWIALALLLTRAQAQKMPDVNIDPEMITVSGLSAGGYMAVQYHVAFSADILGAGIIAGGPFYCAMNDIEIATTSCMVTPDLISLTDLYAAIVEMEAATTIDSTKGLSDDQVWLYSGTADTVVVQGVMDKLNEFYGHYIDGSRIATVFNISSEHSIVTAGYGSDCSYLGEPFINNCDFDSAGALLQHLYGPLAPPVGPLASNLFEVDQAAFIPGVFTPSEVGLSSSAYVYAPEACQSSLARHSNSSACKLHIAFHGCEQDLTQIGTTFVLNAGYLAWAEANGIVVLFPQAATNDLNPKGCFDWWGFTGIAYPTKEGYQMATVYAMQTQLLTH